MEEVVKEAVVTEQPADEKPAPVVPETTNQAQPGDKTPSSLLLKSLQEEREARRKAEEELELLKSSSSSDVFSDEGKVLQRKIDEQDEKIKTILQDNAKKDVLMAHPVLKEKWEEFESFRADPENKGMNLKTAARAFLIDNGLLEPQRKGLEKQTGGQRVPVTPEMSVEDIKILRETNFRKYQLMLERGEIKI